MTDFHQSLVKMFFKSLFSLWKKKQFYEHRKCLPRNYLDHFIQLRRQNLIDLSLNNCVKIDENRRWNWFIKIEKKLQVLCEQFMRLPTKTWLCFEESHNSNLNYVHDKFLSELRSKVKSWKFTKLYSLDNIKRTRKISEPGNSLRISQKKR